MSEPRCLHKLAHICTCPLTYGWRAQTLGCIHNSSQVSELCWSQGEEQRERELYHFLALNCLVYYKEFIVQFKNISNICLFFLHKMTLKNVWEWVAHMRVVAHRG